MSESAQPYGSWKGIDQASKDVAKQRHRAGEAGSLTLNDQLLQMRFDRLLCRVFVDGHASRWMLKGGTALLARIPDSRRTQDLDLAPSDAALDDAIADLRERARQDLGDHITFEIATVKGTGVTDHQPYRDAQTVTFDCFDGTKKLGQVKVDVVAAPAPIGDVDLVEPSTRIDLPRPLPTVPWRLYPLVDQVADKVCATMATGYGDGSRRSTRVKDLADLVAIATTQKLDLRQLQLAIATERRRRRLDPFDRLDVPDGWAHGYARLAAETKTLREYPTIDDALALVDDFVTPALREQPIPPGTTWAHGAGWHRPAPAAGDHSSIERGREDTQPPVKGGGDVYVQPHTRNGRPVAGHWRRARGR